MVAVRLSAVITDERELIVTVPDDIPAGPVELVIESPETASAYSNPDRNIARAKLAAAGLLSQSYRLPPGTRIPTDDEVRAADALPPGARPSEDLINEDRDEQLLSRYQRARVTAPRPS